MGRAGFRLIGYGVESFSRRVLHEFGKEEIHPFIEPTIRATLARGITPFLDVILASPNSHLSDVVLTVGKCLEYLRLGCEISIYPKVIPFAGSALAADPGLQDLIVSERREIARTDRFLERNVSIEPRRPDVRRFLEEVGETYRARLRARLAGRDARMPSRERSVLYIRSALDIYPELFGEAAEESWVQGAGPAIGAAERTPRHGTEPDGCRDAQVVAP